MSKQKKLKYMLAGLDLLINKAGDIFFIEANSFPGLLTDYKNLYGHCHPLEKLTAEFKDQFVLIYTKEMYNSWREPKIIKNIISKLTGKDCLIIFPDQLAKIKNKKITLLTPLSKIKDKLKDNQKVTIINPNPVSQTTEDKLLIYNIVRSIKNITTPKTIGISNYEELKKAAGQFSKSILKPRFGSQGDDIYKDKLISKKILNRHQHWIIQEFIDTKNDNNNYCDIRAFVINGKYAGALSRVSKNPVVNVSRGGEVEKIEKNLEKKISKISEESVKAIENKLNAR